MVTHRDVPEERHKAMRAAQGAVHLENAAQELYLCWMQCLKDGYPWPEDLDAAWRILWAHLGRAEALRLQIMGRGAK